MLPSERATLLTHMAAMARIRERVERLVTAWWLQMPDYRDEQIDRMAALVVPIVYGSSRQISVLTTRYLAQLGVEVDKPPESWRDVRDVPAREVYQRPGITVWSALAAGKQLSEAVQLGLDRLTSLAATDLQLAQTRTARDVMAADSRVTGFRRVLTGAGCGLCSLASSERYARGDLLPIHPRCDCGVAPIIENRDPGQVLDSETVDRMREQATESAFEVREHGEYGPTLIESGHDFATV